MVIIIANYTSEAEDVAKDWDIDDCNNELIKIKKRKTITIITISYTDVVNVVNIWAIIVVDVCFSWIVTLLASCLFIICFMALHDLPNGRKCTK